MPEGRVFEKEAWKQKCAWHVGGKAKKLVWLDHRVQELLVRSRERSCGVP